MTILSLTRKQQETAQNLKAKNFDSITQQNATLLLKKILDDKQASKEYIPTVFEYEKFKFPNKSDKQINQYVTKKLAKSDKTTWKEVVQEMKDKGLVKDNSSKQSDEGKHDIINRADRTAKQLDKFSSKPSQSKLDDLLDKLLDGDGGETDDRFPGKSNRIDYSVVDEPVDQPASKTDTGSSDSGSSLDTITDSLTAAKDLLGKGNAFYKKNKEQIDNIFNKLNKEGFESGQIWPAIASLSYPELTAFQKFIDKTPLGMTAQDDKNFEYLLTFPSENKLSTVDTLKTVGKAVVSPDAWGKAVSEGLNVAQVPQAFRQVAEAITGEVPDWLKTDSQIQFERDEENRRAEKEAEKKNIVATKHCKI
jgi:hypothetical protein